MKKPIKTIKAFAAQSNMPATLIRAVIRQCGGFESFKEMAEDVSDHGASGGFHGFIYYTDTVKFTKNNKAAILEYAKEQASDFGQSMIGMIAGFGCLKMSEEETAEALYNSRSAERTNVYNALAWYALEEVARVYCDAAEDN